MEEQTVTHREQNPENPAAWLHNHPSDGQQRRVTVPSSQLRTLKQTGLPVTPTQHCSHQAVHHTRVQEPHVGILHGGTVERKGWGTVQLFGIRTDDVCSNRRPRSGSVSSPTKRTTRGNSAVPGMDRLRRRNGGGRGSGGGAAEESSRDRASIQGNRRQLLPMSHSPSYSVALPRVSTEDRKE